MTSRERVLAAFEHREPDRVPLWYGADEGVTQGLIELLQVPDEEALMRRLHIDFRRVRERYIGPALNTYPDGRRENFWGVLRDGFYYGQPLSHPLSGVTTVEDVMDYTGPSPDEFDFSHVAKECEQWPDQAIIGGPWAVVFTDASELMGMEEFFINMSERPDVVHAIMNKVCDIYCEMAVRFFEAADGLIDIFFFGDDFGTQRALIISPEAWRYFCKPYIKRLNDLGKQAGLKTMFHSCGAVREIIPDLIEIGVDALNPVQVRAAGMEPMRLKRDFGEYITFHGAFDHQHILPHGTVEEVRTEVHRIIGLLAPAGGFCLAPSHDLLLREFPLENIVAMYDEAYAYETQGR